MASLVVMGPPLTGTTFPLSMQHECIIGRSGFCDVVLNKRSISREHARIVERRGEYLLEDLDSVNGTFLNGRPIHSPVPLQDGDRINLYDVPIRFFRFEESKTPSSGSMLAYQDPVSATDCERLPNRLRVRLDNVLGIIQQLGHSLDVNVILPKILEILFRTFPQASSGEILLVEKDGHLSPRATKRGNEVDGSTATDMPGDYSLSRQTLEAGVGSIHNAGDESCESALESTFSSTMYVPIVIGPTRSALGIVILETEDSQAKFCEDDLAFVSGAATLAAQAIGYARAHEVVVEHELTRHQLETARQIQLRMLPTESPQVPGYSFAQYYSAAQIVGGDAYIYHRLSDGRLMLAVADASGKGLPASLRIAEFISELRHCISSATSLKAAMDELNRSVCRSDSDFITFCLVVLDPQKHTLSIANAGHPLPRLRKRNGTVFQVGENRTGFPLGVLLDNPCHPVTIKFDVGDELVLYTDGVSEAFNPAGDIFGMERLDDCLLDQVTNATERVNRVIAAVNHFRQGRKQSDDLCIVALTRTSS